MHRSLILISLIILLSACAAPRIPFPESELAAIKLKGDKTLKGKVFLIDQLEEEQIGADFEVTLEPVSSYSDQWYEVVYLNEKSLKKADPRYENYVMKAVADKEGMYALKDVAPGNYYLTTPFMWSGITCSANIVKTKVWISKKISVKPGDTALDVPLTKEYTSPTIVCDLYNQSTWEKEEEF